MLYPNFIVIYKHSRRSGFFGKPGVISLWQAAQLAEPDIHEAGLSLINLVSFIPVKTGIRFFNEF